MTDPLGPDTRQRRNGRRRWPTRDRGGAGRADAEPRGGQSREHYVRQRRQRRDRLGPIAYPPHLPVSQRKDELLEAIRDHQVVVVAGETGSGKTTQLPKICLELGRGVAGMIGHTQPRRLAARAVADRIAAELGTELGDVVGYQVRFSAQTSDHTLVKLMTDGILLTELGQDRRLLRYDTLIIDEAHERSLNVDFILGYLKRLLPRRPDLKVIITSATIDPHRFAAHFEDVATIPARRRSTPVPQTQVEPGTPCVPVIEVSGRTYPVEIRYRPVEEARSDGPTPAGSTAATDLRDQVEAILDAVDELSAEGPGDILVFLSGEREIRDTADALRGQSLRNTEILPLYARLSTGEQHRVFASHVGRRIILATNVAETSLTVPGIKYVIDPGTARISRYSNRLKVQRLPIEPISQASAKQRAGRCGRVADGICIRLYSEEDYALRPEFTEPEILRTNLASVILQMAALRLGTVEDFPFVDSPDRRQVRDGLELLRELGALQAGEGRGTEARLTPLGGRLAELPVDPRLARMVLAAADQGCVREVLVIAAALAIQDPRERPAAAGTGDRPPADQPGREAADQMHRRFADPSSDFLAYLNLWHYLRERQRALSSSQFRKLCRTEHLNYLRVREWQDLEAQLRQAARAIGVTAGAFAAEPDGVRIHQALLAGLLSHIGLYDVEKRDYVGARNARFAINPGSVLFRNRPKAVMAAELVETTRLWARVVASIEPEWAEPLAAHLVKRTYSEPHWERNQGAVIAYERVTLYGVPIVARRKVNYGRIDPELSRELFIRHALVEGDWETHHSFLQENQGLVTEVEDLEDRVRRRDILVDDQVLFDFYDARIPAEVVSARHFDSWWKRARRTDPDLLTFDKQMLVSSSAAEVSDEDYPDIWPVGSIRLPLTYQFEPGADADGVTVHIPLHALPQVRQEPFDWQVPGLREELVVALLRSLPKTVRRALVPIPDHARAALAGIRPDDGPLLDVLADRLTRMTRVRVSPDDFDLTRIPAHLTMSYRIVDDGRTIAEGKDLDRLAEEVRPAAQAALSTIGGGLERTGLQTWDFDTLPKTVEERRAGRTLVAYPALADEGGDVAIRLYGTPEEQAAAMWGGVRRLLLQSTPAPITSISSRLSNKTKLTLTRNPHGSIGALLDDCAGAAVDLLIAEAGGPPWDERGFARLRAHARAELNQTMLAVVGRLEPVLAAAQRVEQRLPATPAPGLTESYADIRAHLERLVYPGFVTRTGYERLSDLPRYLQGIDRRLDKLPANPVRDRELAARIREVENEHAEVAASLPPDVSQHEDVQRVRWMLEELRLSYFAQGLRTAYPVSDKRVYRALDDLEARYRMRATLTR